MLPGRVVAGYGLGMKSRNPLSLFIIAGLLLTFLTACSLPRRAYVQNLSDKPISVSIVTVNYQWNYWLQPGEVVSMATDDSCELTNLAWMFEQGPTSRPLGRLAELCPGKVWVITGEGAEAVIPVPDSWTTSPPPNVASLPAWSPSR